MSARPLLATAALAATGLVLASCASGSDDAAAPADAASDAIVIEHALGETTIEGTPERVAAIGWGNHDVALALGVAPVGVDDQTWSADGSDGLGLYEWSLDAYADLGADEPVIFDTTDGIDFEAIADSAPDVILAAQSGLTEEDYATLTEIAPTVAYPDIPWYTPWRDAATLDAAALGMAEEGEQLVADVDQQIADATAGSDFAGKTAAFFYMSAADLSTVSVYAEGDSRTAFLGDLGFDFPEVAVAAGEDGAFYADISAENADQLDDVDVIVTYGDDTLLDALQSDELWSTVPAVQNGAVVVVGDGDATSSAVSPSVLSIPWVLNDYVAMLDEAVAASE
ncbi:iron-siderophore ABC transporter substrate-binding protein [Microbacterium sp. ZXX196]|uniref:iron-siderophore ABC transporter substrate-binding protein n=1 Tax=Microbacterium sp. ZXX196 TaxID=2609291 RepID=UPI0012B9E117|nr:iron-siderophore ABC transporter substrate-binding protein [Microbacterium sp. ZXX196]MTE24634.1 ABC transporter substrate-binding protein [Microbacterium sp. ZXX196]